MSRQEEEQRLLKALRDSIDAIKESIVKTSDRVRRINTLADRLERIHKDIKKITG